MEKSKEYDLTKAVGDKVIKFLEENWPQLKDNDDLWAEITDAIMDVLTEPERVENEGGDAK